MEKHEQTQLSTNMRANKNGEKMRENERKKERKKGSNEIVLKPTGVTWCNYFTNNFFLKLGNKKQN